MPAHLELSLNGTVLGEFGLIRERVTIGRNADGDVHLDNVAVSGTHAVIITMMGDSYVEDLESTNGTYVNGNLVRKHALRNGDVIRIGRHQLTYINNDASPDDNFEQTVVLRPGAFAMAAAAAARDLAKASATPPAATPPPAPPAATPPPALAPTPQAAAGGIPQPSTRPSIRLMSGPGAGKQLELRKDRMTLGRPGVQVAVIRRLAEGYFISDVEGPEPIVNGLPTAGQDVALKDQDVVELAGIKLAFLAGG